MAERALDTSWSFPPGAIAAIAILAGLYVRRWRRCRRESGPSAAGLWRAASFAAGLAAIVVALISPVDALAGQLFIMHMVQHMLLLDIAPVLLLLGLTRVLLRPVTRQLLRLEASLGPLGHPATGIVLYVAVIWLYHVPAVYDLALDNEAVHVVFHLLLALGGGAYWWHLLSPIPGRHPLHGLQPVGYMVATKILVGLLGIVLTFAPEPLYAFYEQRPSFWGLTAGTDQAVGGAFMAMEQSIVMGIALVALLIAALQRSERDDRRAERLADRPTAPRAAS